MNTKLNIIQGKPIAMHSGDRGVLLGQEILIEARSSVEALTLWLLRYEVRLSYSQYC